MERVIERRGAMPRWLAIGIGVLAGGLLVYELRNVIVPVFFAFLLAYMLDPVVDRLESRRVPRGVAIGLLLAIATLVVTMFMLIAVPGIVRDVRAFIEDLPGTIGGLRDKIVPYLEARGVHVPSTFEEISAELQSHSTELRGAFAPAASAFKTIVGGTASVVTSVASVILFAVMVVYLLYDFDRITAAARDLVPSKIKPFVLDIAAEIDVTLSQFIRGQLILMLVLGIMYAVAYSLLGVRLAVVIGIIAGLVAFIPYVGGATAIGLAVLMCALDWPGLPRFIGVWVAYGVIQVLESYVLQPRIVGDKVGLPAVWVLIALMAGGELFGFAGVLLAVPAAAVIKIFVMRGVAWYRKSELFLGGPHFESPVVAGVIHEEGLPDSPLLHEEKVAADAADPELAAVASEPEPPKEVVAVVAEVPEPEREASDSAPPEPETKDE